MRFPAIFVSHGAPTLALDDADPTHTFLSQLGTALGARPSAVVCISAHWEALDPTVGGAAQPETIHDFGGFPEALYRIRYAAPGDPALAGRVWSLLRDAGFEAAIDPDRGIDHGAWVPLSLMYAGADVPVIQLSVQSRRDAAHAYALGRALAPLREEGVLLLGSGGATHDLRRAMVRARRQDDGPPPEDVAAFERWLVTAVEAGDHEALLAWLERAPMPLRNHPTPEHFLPLFVPLGAAGAGTRGRTIHRTFAYGALSMAAFRWD